MHTKETVIKNLIESLNDASRSYYNTGHSLMSDSEWDSDFDRLVKLEQETGIIYSNSPTQHAGYTVASNLPKIKHSTPLLSLGKTKSIDDLIKWLGNREGVLMRKLDGGTQIANYDVRLKYLATRGSSATNEGQDITHNAISIIGIPKEVKSFSHIQVVGEGMMYREKLGEINSRLQDDDKYANARNLANATSSMLDSKIVADREIRFIAFGTLECEFDTKMEELNELAKEGFNVVEHVLVTKDNLAQEVERMTNNRGGLSYDTDGLVLAHNDIGYGLSLGKTSHHFNNAIAYKFFDESVTTTLLDILVDVGKSGQLSYTALFEPVEIDNTMVEKASVHNYDYIKGLELGVGDTILVTKKNQIIPQLTDNETCSGTFEKVLNCPFCGSTLVHQGVHQFCTNYQCEKQVLGRLVHFCSRNAMDIQGFSEESIKKIMEIKLKNGLSVLSSVSDIYNIPNNRETLYKLDGFGKKKVDSLIAEIEKSKTQPLDRVLYGLSIPQIGKTASRKLAEYFENIDNLLSSDKYTYYHLIGDSAGNSLNEYVHWNESMEKTIALLCVDLVMTQPKQQTESDILNDKTFVITGDVEHFKNRKELESKIVSLGGKIGGGVSKTTDYLICNNPSQSSKSVKANQLGVKIITENEFLEMIK